MATTVAAVVLAFGASTDASVDTWTGGAAGFRLWALGALLPTVAITVVMHLRRPDHRLGHWLALCAALLGAATCAGLWLHGGSDTSLRDGVAVAGAALDVATIVAVAALLATFPTGRAARLVEPVLVWGGSAFILVVAILVLGVASGLSPRRPRRGRRCSCLR
jgi:hypothetical protein